MHRRHPETEQARQYQFSSLHTAVLRGLLHPSDRLGERPAGRSTVRRTENSHLQTVDKAEFRAGKLNLTGKELQRGTYGVPLRTSPGYFSAAKSVVTPRSRQRSRSPTSRASYTPRQYITPRSNATPRTDESSGSAFTADLVPRMNLELASSSLPQADDGALASHRSAVSASSARHDVCFMWLPDEVFLELLSLLPIYDRYNLAHVSKLFHPYVYHPSFELNRIIRPNSASQQPLWESAALHSPRTAVRCLHQILAHARVTDIVLDGLSFKRTVLPLLPLAAKSLLRLTLNEHMQLLDEDLVYVAQCTALLELNVADNCITDAGLAVLSTLRRLEHLDVSSPEHTVPTQFMLPQRPQRLKASLLNPPPKHSITDVGMLAIVQSAYVSKLKRIILTGCNITVAGIVALLNAAPSAQHLGIACIFNSQLGDEDEQRELFRWITENAWQLQSLDIRGSISIPLLDVWPELRALWLDSLQLSGQSFGSGAAAFLPVSTAVASPAARRKAAVTAPDQLQVICTRCPRLTHLTIEGMIDDAQFDNVLKLLYLEELRLPVCVSVGDWRTVRTPLHRVSFDSLLRLGRACPRLAVLDVSGVEGLTMEMCEELRNTLPLLRELKRPQDIERGLWE
eukprot:TRINITY_DN5369_c0_g2_i1.p1 TRINITY_DN5369_c0_g2~~TRINITY_DN5369_c0_g2_i1.p1  ORF type:complete len:626 (-),score=133.31 TRINITY_DN5369_c0_g2_i1:721-2598(-)